MDCNFLGKTILIAEDDELSRYFFEKAIKKTRANLFFVPDGMQALKMIEENAEIDLVIMDIRLPKMDGIEATRKIKALNPELPVIIETAYAMDTVRDEALKSGCDEFITKPIRIETLLTILKKHLIY